MHRAGTAAAATALDRLEASPALTLTFPSAEHHAAARAWLRRLPERRLGYTDAVSFAVVAATGCRGVLTFDEDFVAAGFRVWRRGGRR